MRNTILAILAFLAVTMPLSARTIVPREDPAAVLRNPDMGWVLYENHPLDQRPNGASTLVTLPDESFPEVDEVALMFSWYDVEKTLGVYDFSKVDYAYDYWRKRGKRNQFRMSAESLLLWSALDPPSGKGIPDYALQQIPADKKQTRHFEQLTYTFAEAREPFYRQRLRTFLRAVAGHSKGRPVSPINLRGFGLWGEWHSGYRHPSVEEARSSPYPPFLAIRRGIRRPQGGLETRQAQRRRGPAL